MAKDSPITAQINWTNIVGTSYRVWFTPDLTKPFSLWSPLEDAFSEDTNVLVSVSTAGTPNGFFRVQIPTNGTLPAVQIFSPTNNQTVSGTIAVGVGAQITNQLQGVNLYLDDALVGFIDSGGIRFDLDTSHFENGAHTLYVAAVDTANNEVSSGAITLDFENPVRWLDACSMFNSFVPIDVDSDIYPADWLVSVTDTNGTIVRTISGSTTDGIIQTIWDGTDDNGQPLPVENAYQITVDVTETSGSSMMMASSLASDSGETAVSSAENLQGVPEFAVQ
ncbi:MAG TPA: Ig-like domain-containing protein [Methylomirabilota bacterium]|nr:Ig-like domain-containing protein [Methylomirabilota bacterium]